jgi:hypothetical protein
MATKRLSNKFYPLLRSFIFITRFLLSVLGYSIERLVFSLTETVEEYGRFAWGAGDACLALWDILVFFVALPLRVRVVSSSLWMLSLTLRFFVNSVALSVLASALCGCFTCKTLVAKVDKEPFHHIPLLLAGRRRGMCSSSEAAIALFSFSSCVARSSPAAFNALAWALACWMAIFSSFSFWITS